MTRDEFEAFWQKATTEEKVAFVAEKAMGWKRHHRNTAHWMRADDDAIAYKVTAQVGDWNPVRDIADAWEVWLGLERLCEQWRMGESPHLFRLPSGACVRLPCPAPQIFVVAPDYPEAICKAACLVRFASL